MPAADPRRTAGPPRTADLPRAAGRGGRRLIVVLALAFALGLPLRPDPVLAEPTAEQVLTDIGLSADEKQRVMNGEFVTPRLSGVSERDLPVGLAVFLTKVSPADLATRIMTGDLIAADLAVRTHGRFGQPGSLTDLAGLKIDGDGAQRLARAQPGDAVNLATREIAEFNALASDGPAALGDQLKKMLLARYRAYRASGLAGVAAYDRGSGRSTDVASDLRKASQSASVFEKHMPALHAVLLGYPKASVPGMQQDFRWVTYDVEGTTIHGHAFTDQVAGFGGAVKRGIGRRVLADKVRQVFETSRTILGK